MKKLTKKVVPVVLAGAMVFGMCVPSMAATVAETETYAPVDFVTEWNADGTIKDIDMERYAYYVAAGQALKNAPAFTNSGTSEEGMSENNLFGTLDDAYGYVSETVWDLEKGGAAGTLHSKYGSWDTYLQMVEANSDYSIAEQVKMVDSIAYLKENDGENIADYWYVRHGSLDRDTSFANQALLSLALKSRLGNGIEKLNYKFAYGKGHSGNYDNPEAYKFFTDYTDPVTDGTAIDTTKLGEATEITYTFDDVEKTVNRYTLNYLTKTAALTDDQYANAKVNIYVPANATAQTPVIYMVNNSGWQSNDYSDTLIVADGTVIKGFKGESIAEGYSVKGTSQSDLAAMALNDGYIVIDAGLRTRKASNTNSPVTVADAKAVISYVRTLGLGDTMWISGTSGGGALSCAIGADGMSTDFEKELANIGAVADDSAIQGVIAYCPITDLGHADGSYEFTYASARQMLLDDGFTSDDAKSGYILSETTMTVSPKLAYEWATYVNGLGFAGTDNAFDTASLTGSGTVYDEAKAMIIASLNEGVVAAGGKDAFIASISERAYATTGGKMGGFYEVPVTDQPATDTKPTAPKTGNNMMPLFAVVVAAGAVALASTRKRVVR